MTDRDSPAADNWRMNLEARLRGLPPLPVPSGLEAKLLADIPARQPGSRRAPWHVRGTWALAALGSAAAAVVAVFSLGQRHEPDTPLTGTAVSAPPETRGALDPFPVTQWAARGGEDLSDPAGTAFHWPVEAEPVVPFGRIQPSDLFN